MEGAWGLGHWLKKGWLVRLLKTPLRALAQTPMAPSCFAATTGAPPRPAVEAGQAGAPMVYGSPTTGLIRSRVLRPVPVMYGDGGFAGIDLALLPPASLSTAIAGAAAFE